MLLSEQAYTKIDKELAKYPADQRSSAIMSSLRIAQEENGWLSSDLVAEVARYIGVEPIAVQEVATFYNMFEMKPVGKFKITVCTNLPCALRDGVKTAEYLKEKLGIGFNETTPDGAITLKEGECMGACGDSPVLLVNNHHMCVRMSQEKIDEMLAEMSKEAQA
ncbi:NADH-quinone oxidoreductase subunit NuoE [Advenella sp. RU8]|uniref:NADH-quinone oxidoreductase subunit NuoE n=1 Tax=Advenella sp. RU8 TaxID=3399575 RepID=UPI003AAD8E9B